MKELLKKQGPFALRNVRLFAWFQMLYGARAYYPILAIFFVDLGLTLDQFVILNVAWAISIVLLEVPSGALADVMGRRRLLITASCLMAIEMAILVFAPANGSWWLFSLCLVNRILSGASEAAASGADQALAYDTLEKEGIEDSWDDALSTSMSWQSAASVVAMTLGGLLYSPDLINRAFGWAGMEFELSREIALRIPVSLVFLQAIACICITWKMKEINESTHTDTSLKGRASATFRTTIKAAKWVWQTPLALTLVTGGFLIDAVIRNFATINSQYFRLIQIPEWSFGFIAAGTSMFGIFVPKFARKLSRQVPPVVHVILVFLVGILSIALLAPAWPYWGILPAMLSMLCLGWNGFIMNRHLNELTSSDQRATVLSVRGLASNLSYGTYSLAFAGMLALARKSAQSTDADSVTNEALSSALTWQPFYFAATLIAFIIFARRGKQKISQSI